MQRGRTTYAPSWMSWLTGRGAEPGGHRADAVAAAYQRAEARADHRSRADDLRSSFGRPSIPIETYLRLMFLKFRYRLGYESLCAEVADSIGWRLFTRIGIDGKVPHPTTLMKITTRCGSEVIEQLNETLCSRSRRRGCWTCTSGSGTGSRWVSTST